MLFYLWMHDLKAYPKQFEDSSKQDFFIGVNNSQRKTACENENKSWTRVKNL